MKHGRQFRSLDNFPHLFADENMPTRRPNSEAPTCNRTLTQLEQARQRQAHKQRLLDIKYGARRGALGNKWREGPHRSKPTYAHVTQNLKRAQMQSELYDTIDHENSLLLGKMSALMRGAIASDPTKGTWEFSPGVRLNRFQMPVIDHGISHEPMMPQRGAAREPESLNPGARRRELERITNENRGIVERIQGRSSQFSASEMVKRSEELDRHLLLMRRPRSGMANLPTPPVGGFHESVSPLRAQSARARRPAHRGTAQPPTAALLAPVQAGHSKLLIGLCPGVARGSKLVLQPHEGPYEETLVVENVALQREGLEVTLEEACQQPHPAGAPVQLFSEADMAFNRAHLHLGGASHLYEYGEVSVRVP